MQRREFLKLLAATTLGGLGIPTLTIQSALGQSAGPKTKLKDAIKQLKNDPERFLRLLGAAFASAQIDVRLGAASVYYFTDVGGDFNRLIKAARKLSGQDGHPDFEPGASALNFEPGVNAFLNAIRTVNGGDRVTGLRCPYRGTTQASFSKLSIEAEIIRSIWNGISPAQQLERVHRRYQGVKIIAAYTEQYGSTVELLEAADAEIDLIV